MDCVSLFVSQIGGQLRIAAQLVDCLPIIGNVEISFLEPPVGGAGIERSSRETQLCDCSSSLFSHRDHFDDGEISSLLEK